MGRTKIYIAVAGVIVTLLGVMAAVVMRSDSGTKRVAAVATQAPADTSNPGVAAVLPSAPATQPGSAGRAPSAPATTAKGTAAKTAPPVSVPAQPSAQEIQKIIIGITAQAQAAAATNGSLAPVTQEQIEAQVRAQLKQLGITY